MQNTTLLSSLVLILSAGAARCEPRIDRYFGSYTGAFVIKDLSTGKITRNDPERCARRLSPCSTFKIPSSLIALETGAVPDERKVIKWDGVHRPMEAWNRDHDMASAFQESAVWFYQALARKIGAGPMKVYLDKLHYGNADVSGGADSFWLQSSLLISADEQVEFLERLLTGKAPFSERTLGIVERIMLVGESHGSRLRGKTGSGAGTDGKRNLNWFVGYVEKDSKKYVFATSIQAPDIPGRHPARKITEGILAEMGLY